MQESIYSEETKGRVLVVDDQPITLRVMSRILSDGGFDYCSASNGREALEIFEKKPDFDLIILDVMMPKISGFEVCRRIRERYSLFEMPILFLTAKTMLTDMMEGFEAGANDFIRKPFEKDELLIRAKTLIKLKKLTSANKVLEEAVQLKNRFMEISIHDLKNPLTSIMALSGMLRQDESTPDENREMLSIIHSSSESMLKIVEELLEAARIESGKVTLLKERLDLNDSIREVITENSPAAASKEQSIEFYPEEKAELFVNADRGKIKRIIDNLLSNAIKYSPYDKPIEIAAGLKNGRVIMYVKDYGQGLSEEDKEIVFSRFSKLSAKPTGGESSSGIGLSIAKDLTEMHGGRIWMESKLGEGSCFFVELPAAE